MKNQDDARARDRLAEILRGFLVRCGSEEARNNLASRLHREGLSAEDLRELCELIEGRGKPPAETAGIIGVVLKTEASWRAFVNDLVFARAARDKRQREARNAATPYPNMPGDLQPSPTGNCEHGRAPTESCPECDSEIDQPPPELYP